MSAAGEQISLEHPGRLLQLLRHGRRWLERDDLKLDRRRRLRHCEEPTGPAFGRPDDELRDEAIQSCLRLWIASRSLSPGARSRDPVARNDGSSSIQQALASRGVLLRVTSPDARPDPASNA